MQITTKVLLVAGVLSLTCIFHIFDLNDSRVDMAETFVRGDSRVLEVTGEIRNVFLLPLFTRLNKGDRNRIFFFVQGAKDSGVVQIIDQDVYSGRVRRYCVAKAGCFEASLDGAGPSRARAG
jgi:hypothetical protein